MGRKPIPKSLEAFSLVPNTYYKHLPDHCGVDLGPIDEDYGEGGVNGELAEHGQRDADPAQVSARRRHLGDERPDDTRDPPEHVEPAQRPAATNPRRQI